MMTMLCRHFLSLIFSTLLFVHSFAPIAQACTTFCLIHGKELVFGRNYDFPIGYGLVMINKRNVFKTAQAESGSRPAQWTSKFGSVTFNQFGRDMPMGGMNEAGLVVELMQLDETQYPPADSRPAVGCLEWIQYQLDNSSTVQEVIQHSDEIRIQSNVGIHFLIADSKADVATIEFLNGRLVVNSGDKMPVKALANNTYQESVAYLNRFGDFDGSEKLPNSMRSLDRFTRAAAMIGEYKDKDSKSAIDYSFEILRNVAQGSHTKWSIVYDLRKLTVHFLTSEANSRRFIALKSFDFACASPVKTLDVNADLAGDVAEKFSDYTLAENRKLVISSFQNSPFTKEISLSELEEIAKHPEKSICQNRVD